MEYNANTTIAIPVVNQMTFKLSTPVRKQREAGDTSDKSHTFFEGEYPYTMDRAVYPPELVFH